MTKGPGLKTKGETVLPKTALVTGPPVESEKRSPRSWAHDGFAVVVNYPSNAKEAGATVAEIKSDVGQAIAVKADVGNSAEVEQLFEETVKAFGSVDVVVNNSGTFAVRCRIPFGSEARCRLEDTVKMIGA